MPRILLDQNTPYGLRSSFPGHEARTAYELGWAELANGDLLRAAEAQGFDAMITCDQNIRYQQNMAERKIALVVLTTNNWDLLNANLDRIRGAEQRGPKLYLRPVQRRGAEHSETADGARLGDESS